MKLLYFFLGVAAGVTIATAIVQGIEEAVYIGYQVGLLKVAKAAESKIAKEDCVTCKQDSKE